MLRVSTGGSVVFWLVVSIQLISLASREFQELDTSVIAENLVSIQLISLASREAIKRLPDGYTLTVFPFN